MCPIKFYSYVLLFLAFCCSGPLAVIADPIRVVYPGSVDNGSASYEYIVQVLQLALSSQQEKYTFEPHVEDNPKKRNFQLLHDGLEMDVAWGGTSISLEEEFLPIRFPLLKGLMGWRIALVKEKNVNIFNYITTPEGLKEFIPGQMHNWSDTEVFSANKIRVSKSNSLEGLYEMLSAGRFDYFPRSISEVWTELDAHQDMDITVELNTLIYYPKAYYFFVNKKNSALAEVISSGLEAALLNGDFEELFLQYTGESLIRVKAENRRVIRLNNPQLSDATPFHRPELWIDLKPEND